MDIDDEIRQGYCISISDFVRHAIDEKNTERMPPQASRQKKEYNIIEKLLFSLRFE